MTHDHEDDTPESGAADSDAVQDIDERMTAFREAGRPFAVVTVVRRESPVSANVGDRALITADGTVYGWIGGAECAQSVAVDEAVQAIDSGDPVLVGLAPDPATVDRPGVVAYPMTCHSGGTLELFIDPVTPTPRLVVVGDTPVAWAVANAVTPLRYSVTVVTSADSDRPDDLSQAVEVVSTERLEEVVAGVEAVIVASMGAVDEVGVATAIEAEIPYTGLVASDPRHEEVVRSVADELGIPSEEVAGRVTTPAGLDIGAKTPPEIAVSIAAELVAWRRDGGDVSTLKSGTDQSLDSGGGNGDSEVGQDTETRVDPVCGMTVSPEDAAVSVTIDGETEYFCSEACATAFETDTAANN